MMRKKISALFLAVIMVVTLLPTAFAAENSYSDTQGHWGEDAIDRWSGYGVISGTGSGLFDPNAPLTRAQAAQIFANLLNLSATASVAQYTDVAVGSWYYDAIAKCVAAGILNGTGSNTMSPNTYVSREELFVMFARALGIQPQASAGVTFTDSASTASWAAGYVNALADMGVVGGSGDGTLAPKADIDRASVVALLDKAITAYGNTSGATVGSSSGIVLVVADNVTVMGSVETLVVAGGSAGISGSTVGSISVVGESASVSVGGSANVGQVSVTGANASVTVRGEATVSGVTIADTAQGAELTVSGDATVTAVDSAAQNVTISGDGTIEAATVSGDNTTVDTNGTDLTVPEGTTGVTENDKVVSAGDSVVTEPTEDAGSSGESTTPSRPTNPSRPSYDYYTVTFMLDENTVYDTQRVREGRTVEQPENPTKEGYSFGGWYLDGAVVAYDFTAPVENDITLTARWLANPVTITLMEGQNISTYQTEYGATLNEETLNKVIEAERPYETVIGWWIDSGYDTEYDFTTVVTGDMTLYYRCQGKEYTVTFVIADAQPEAVTDAYGTPVTLPTSTDDAYTWTWYEDEAFTKPVTILSIPGGGLTLYGQWTHTASGLKGHGTESDPYLISTADELIAMGTLSDAMIAGTSCYFELMDNIYLDSHTATVSGDYSSICTGFRGEVEGNGYTIYSATDEFIFLIADTYGDVTIRNLDIFQQGDLNFSLIYLVNREIAEPGNVLVQDIKVRADGVIGTVNNIGSFVVDAFGTGKDSGTDGTLTLDNCDNHADINVSGYAGVFLGGYNDNGYVTYTDCDNHGEISGEMVGLFTGNSWKNSTDYDTTRVTVENCYNYGQMNGTVSCSAFASNNKKEALGYTQAQITYNQKNYGTNGINFNGGSMSVGDSDVDGLGLVVDKTNGTVSIDALDIDGVTYEMRVYAQNSFTREDGTSGGSSYVQLSEEGDQSITLPLIDKMVSSGLEGYTETVIGENAEREEYSNSRYVLINSTDGAKTMVVDKQDMIDNFGDATVNSVTLNSETRYTVVAKDSADRTIASVTYWYRNLPVTETTGTENG